MVLWRECQVADRTDVTAQWTIAVASAAASKVLDLDHAPRYGTRTVQVDQRGGLSLPLVDDQ